MIAKTLLILLSVGMLSTMSGCYDEPSRYDNRPSYQGSGQMIKPDAPTEREEEYRRQRRTQEREYDQERLLRPDRAQ
jgi:hypothetical protein